MIDYQYFPDMNDSVAKLRLAMDNMDGMCLRPVPCYFVSLRLCLCISASSLLVHNPKGKSKLQTTSCNSFKQARGYES
jgi:hypothetical protein